MTDERDPKLSRRYRELGSEEPSRELDQTILAAAHRAAARPHAPLVTPAGRHRWYFAFGAAAILVLAVAVTVQVERQQPDPEALPASPGPVRTDRAEGFYRQEQEKDSKRAEVEKQVERPEPFSDAAPPAREARRAPAREAPPAASPPAEVKPQPSVEAQSGTAAAPSAKADSAGITEPRQRDLAEANRVEGAREPPAAASAPEKAAEVQRRAEPQAAARAPQARAKEDRVVASVAPPTPERLLERIAELRKEGRHDEADKALAEFRQRYPDYRIAEEMLQKVERKK